MLTRMRVERMKRGWTQTYLASVSGVHNAEISKIETRRLTPYPKQAAALGRALGLDPASLQEEIV